MNSILIYFKAILLLLISSSFVNLSSTQLTEELEVNCYEGNFYSLDESGSIDIEILGGIAPYTVNLVGASSSSQTINDSGYNTFEGLLPGEYQVIVVDAEGLERACYTSVLEVLSEIIVKSHCECITIGENTGCTYWDTEDEEFSDSQEGSISTCVSTGKHPTNPIFHSNLGIPIFAKNNKNAKAEIFQRPDAADVSSL